MGDLKEKVAIKTDVQKCIKANFDKLIASAKLILKNSTEFFINKYFFRIFLDIFLIKKVFKVYLISVCLIFVEEFLN